MAQNPALIISSLRGGQNDTDPPITLPDDQVQLARNVEFDLSSLGERRLGGDAITLDGGTIAGRDRVVWIHRHLPSSDETASQLWILAVTGTSASSLAYKTTSWSIVSVTDAITLTGGYQYQLNAVSVHGKLFLCHKSSQNRMHLWDGTTWRRAGLAEPAAPTGANTAAAGTFTGTRYYRVRYTVQSGGTTILRSEPSDALTFAPSGTNTGVTVTKPAAISEGETHWELEASIDNANFYRIATTAVGTTTATDTTAYNTGYAVSGTLSEDIGDYAVPHSAKFVAVDEDRLLLGGSFESDALASRVSWTPVYNDPGVGNDERVPDDTDNYVDLNGYEGGQLTALHGPVNGYVWAFKRQHIYRLVRTGNRFRAYDPYCVTKRRGALRNSVVEAQDQSGRPSLYFLDPSVGPCRMGREGVQVCSRDIMRTWQSVNLDATAVVCFGLYVPDKQQIRWWVATDDSNSPDLVVVLHTTEMETTVYGARRGFTTWDGTMATALCGTLYADNIDDNAARSLHLVPFLGMEGNGLVWRTETGNTDNGTEYSGHIKTKPYTPKNASEHFGIKASTLVATASEASLDVYLTRNSIISSTSQREEEVQKVEENVSLEPVGLETSVIIPMPDLNFNAMRTATIEFKDSEQPSNVQWALEQFICNLTTGQTP